MNMVIAASAAVLSPGVYSVLSLALPPRARSLGFAFSALWILPGLALYPLIGHVADTEGIRTALLRLGGAAPPGRRPALHRQPVRQRRHPPGPHRRPGVGRGTPGRGGRRPRAGWPARLDRSPMGAGLRDHRRVRGGSASSEAGHASAGRAEHVRPWRWRQSWPATAMCIGRRRGHPPRAGAPADQRARRRRGGQARRRQQRLHGDRPDVAEEAGAAAAPADAAGRDHAARRPPRPLPGGRGRRPDPARRARRRPPAGRRRPPRRRCCRAPACDPATGRLAVPSRFAPPCVASAASNGGATWAGVTATTVTVAVYLARGSVASQALAAAAGNRDTRRRGLRHLPVVHRLLRAALPDVGPSAAARLRDAVGRRRRPDPGPGRRRAGGHRGRRLRLVGRAGPHLGLRRGARRPPRAVHLRRARTRCLVPGPGSVRDLPRSRPSGSGSACRRSTWPSGWPAGRPATPGT